MLSWLRRRRQAERLAQADEALIRDHGAEAYGEARQRERDVILPDGTTHAGRTPAHWRRVALRPTRGPQCSIRPPLPNVNIETYTSIISSCEDVSLRRITKRAAFGDSSVKRNGFLRLVRIALVRNNDVVHIGK